MHGRNWGSVVYRSIAIGAQWSRLASSDRAVRHGVGCRGGFRWSIRSESRNDRLLLGLKGTMSEFELNLLRQRSREAIRQKASRGELQFLLPVGFCWNSSGKIEKDPDQRVQRAIQLVFGKMTELGSVRQALLWFRQQNVCQPSSPRNPSEPAMVWKLPVY